MMDDLEIPGGGYCAGCQFSDAEYSAASPAPMCPIRRAGRVTNYNDFGSRPEECREAYPNGAVIKIEAKP